MVGLSILVGGMVSLRHRAAPSRRRSLRHGLVHVLFGVATAIVADRVARRI